MKGVDRPASPAGHSLWGLGIMFRGFREVEVKGVGSGVQNQALGEGERLGVRVKILRLLPPVSVLAPSTTDGADYQPHIRRVPLKPYTLTLDVLNPKP